MKSAIATPTMTSTMIWLALAGSVFGQPKIPGSSIGWSNILVPCAGLALVLLHRSEVIVICRRSRPLVVLTVILATWAVVAAAVGWDPVGSLRYLVKAGGWGLVLLGTGAAARSADHARTVLRTLWGFFVVLASTGVAESIAPSSALWRVFRTHASLVIQPRVAGVLGWPNQFGILMTVGALLGECLGAARLTPRWMVAVTRILFVAQLAQSGSRNAYLTFAALVVAGTLAGWLPWKRAAALALLFAAAAVILPVASLQVGLGRVFVPRLEPRLEGQTWELSNREQSMSLRFRLWHEALAEVRNNPLTGIGPDVFQRQVGTRVMDTPGFNAHDLLLQITVETGFIGLGLTLAWAAAFAAAAGRPSPIVLLPLAAVIVGQVIDCFLHDPTTMVVASICCGALLGSRPEP